MADHYRKIIAKYAWLLSLFFILEFSFFRFVPWSHFGYVRDFEYYLLESLPFILTAVLNIVMARIIFIDIKRHNVETRYVLLATVLYKPVGVCIFLIYLIYDMSTGMQPASTEPRVQIND
jgi:hypothetical protein